MRKPFWTPVEDAVLADVADGRITTTRTLARLRGRNLRSIECRAARLGLTIERIPA